MQLGRRLLLLGCAATRVIGFVLVVPAGRVTTRRLVVSVNDELYTRLEEKLESREDEFFLETAVQVVEEEDEEEVKEEPKELDGKSFLSGVVTAVAVGVFAGAGVGRKLLIDRRAREELELASVARAAQTEARRLVLEAQDANRQLEEAQQSDTPTLTQPTAFALLSWFKQRREKKNQEKLRFIAENKEALAEEALVVAEKTLQLTALDLQVINRLEEAEAAYQYELDIMKQVAEATTDADLLQEAQSRIDTAKAHYDKAQDQALDLARSVVESKDSILAQLNTADSAFATLLTGLVDQRPVSLPTDEDLTLPLQEDDILTTAETVLDNETTSVPVPEEVIEFSQQQEREETTSRPPLDETLIIDTEEEDLIQENRTVLPSFTTQLKKE